MTDVALVSTILIGGMVLLMLTGVSVSISIALPSAICMVLILGSLNGLQFSAQRSIAGMNSFALLAIPFFVLAGVLMNNGGIARRLVNLAKVMVGWAPAPLAQTSVFANVLFSSVSGSAVATAAAVGSTMAPMQREDGYDPAFSAAANVASAPCGFLIPPSNLLIIYALASGGTSIGALFMAGYIPGLLWGAACMVVVYFYARRHPELKSSQLAKFSDFVHAFIQAFPSLLMLVIVIGGIIFGYFTPTEAAVTAVLYSAMLGMIYRELRIRELPRIMLEAARTASIVMFLIGVSNIMSYVMSYTKIPTLIAESLFGWTDSKVVVLLIMMVVLLIIGIPLDSTPAILIFTPIFLPLAQSYGVHPVHFGIMLVFNLSLAVISPPSAPVLFVGAQVAKARLESVIVKLIPFFLTLTGLLFAVVFIPQLSLWLPGVMGLI
ncbi:MAG: TRAP transporter large permease [Brooklawnia sp.]|jgi:tripartite ATP-independent transporter DctM subunit